MDIFRISIGNYACPFSRISSWLLDTHHYCRKSPFLWINFSKTFRFEPFYNEHTLQYHRCTGYPQLSIHCNTSQSVLGAYERMQQRGIKLICNSSLAYRNTLLFIILKVNCFPGDRYSQLNTESNTSKCVHCVYFGSGTEFLETYKRFVFNICVYL